MFAFLSSLKAKSGLKQNNKEKQKVSSAGIAYRHVMVTWPTNKQAWCARPRPYNERLRYRSKQYVGIKIRRGVVVRMEFLAWRVHLVKPHPRLRFIRIAYNVQIDQITTIILQKHVNNTKLG